MTIAICTRNRPDDLSRCIDSIAGQSIGFPAEVLIVDDGDLPGDLTDGFRRSLAVKGIRLRHVRKREAGLLLSRIESVRLAAYERLLFLDDDAELEEGYLQRLSELYDRHPGAAGIGGLDSRLGSSFQWDLFCRVFLYAARRPGKLSPSGYGGAMPRWGKEKAPFETEYLAGFNMSFRTFALRDLQPVDWLTSYSLGEDLYLSNAARRHGPLWIDPGLRIRHHQSPVSRDREEQVAYTEIVNHYRLLRMKNAKAWRIGVQLWTAAGLYLRSLLKKELRRKSPGYRRGITSVLVDECRRMFHESVAGHGHDRRASR